MDSAKRTSGSCSFIPNVNPGFYKPRLIVLRDFNLVTNALFSCHIVLNTGIRADRGELEPDRLFPTFDSIFRLTSLLIIQRSYYLVFGSFMYTTKILRSKIPPGCGLRKPSSNLSETVLGMSNSKLIYPLFTLPVLPFPQTPAPGYLAPVSPTQI